MLIGSVVHPTLDAVGHQPKIGLCQKRRYRLFLHEDRFGLVQQLGASCRILFLIGLLQQCIILGVVELRVIEGLVGRDGERKEVFRIRIVSDPASTRHIELAAFLG